MIRYFFLLFGLILLVFQHNASAEWQGVVSFNGVERYGIDFSDEAPSHIYGNDVYWLFGNKNENGADAQRNLFKVNLLTGLSEEVTFSTPYSLIGNSTVIYKNKIFSVGGQKNNQRNHAMNTLVSYDLDSREIEYLPSSSLSRTGSCTLPYNGNLYVFGGKGFDTFNKGKLKIDDDGFYYTDLVETPTLRPEIQKYNIARKKWTILEQQKLLPGSLSCSQINQHFYFVGRNTYHDPVGELYHYDLINNAWATIKLPTPLSYARLTTVGDRVVVVGKQDFSVGQIWEMYVYDTKAGSWSEKITTPSNSAFVSIHGSEKGIYLVELSSSSDEQNTSYKIYHYDTALTNANQLLDVYLESQFITAEESNDIFTIQSIGANNLVSITLNDTSKYEQITQTKSGKDLKDITKQLYEYIYDDFDFIVYITNENELTKQTGTRFHMSLANDIKGIGRDLYNISDSYGSARNLESLIVLKHKNDIIYGPSLHEFMHRWGNYLKGPLDSERQYSWFEPSTFNGSHWDFLSHGGQLGGWQQEDFNYRLLPDENQYLLNNSLEGRVDFSPHGLGNNFYPYSKLELYLMGAVDFTEIPSLIEPAHKPIDTGMYPFYEISQFNKIDKEELIRINGNREPNVYTSDKELNALFVVISKENLSYSEWGHYKKQVDNFILKGTDEYTRLNNFWEATNGLVSLANIPYHLFLKENLLTKLKSIEKPKVKLPEKLVIKLEGNDNFILAHEEPFLKLLDMAEVEHEYSTAYNLIHNLPNKLEKGHHVIEFTASSNINSSDLETVSVYIDRDTDGDGHIDLLDEFPANPNEWADFDKDGLGNNEDLDDDNDGLSDISEQQHGTDPLNPDSDQDGITDGKEIELGSNPLDANEDIDGDGYTNLEEKLLGSDPLESSDYPQPFPAWINVIFEN
ncbi:MAG: hypothetical protein CMK65_00995 [Pseudoalteromonas sp.]|uniref:hypothetical protein n=1 Tax=Pseudoalteromonas sp. TaxID=53249 RepID=UPI000C97D9D0|nr:hypothetical protein [Pseudoalteromonas sp.]MAD02190.1 hypothetical protein [Pseudoalteromonas sp.]|tara:strand:+ start:41149 stop:43881 length:2733 start_codon:yes stop_codon:yes gene_type:complete